MFAMTNEWSWNFWNILLFTGTHASYSPVVRYNPNLFMLSFPVLNQDVTNKCQRYYSNGKVFTNDCEGCTSGADKCDVCKFENTLPDGSCKGMTSWHMILRSWWWLREWRKGRWKGGQCFLSLGLTLLSLNICIIFALSICSFEKSYKPWKPVISWCLIIKQWLSTWIQVLVKLIGRSSMIIAICIWTTVELVMMTSKSAGTWNCVTFKF